MPPAKYFRSVVKQNVNSKGSVRREKQEKHKKVINIRTPEVLTMHFKQPSSGLDKIQRSAFYRQQIDSKDTAFILYFTLYL